MFKEFFKNFVFVLRIRAARNWNIFCVKSISHFLLKVSVIYVFILIVFCYPDFKTDPNYTHFC